MELTVSVLNELAGVPAKTLTPKRLQKLVNKFGLTESETLEVINLVVLQRANPARAVELAEEADISINQVWALYELRNSVSGLKDGPSLKDIAAFVNDMSDTFDVEDVDTLSVFLRDMHTLMCAYKKTKGTARVSHSIRDFVAFMEEHDIESPRDGIDALEDAVIEKDQNPDRDNFLQDQSVQEAGFWRNEALS